MRAAGGLCTAVEAFFLLGYILTKLVLAIVSWFDYRQFAIEGLHFRARGRFLTRVATHVAIACASRSLELRFSTPRQHACGMWVAAPREGFLPEAGKVFLHLGNEDIQHLMRLEAHDRGIYPAWQKASNGKYRRIVDTTFPNVSSELLLSLSIAGLSSV